MAFIAEGEKINRTLISTIQLKRQLEMAKEIIDDEADVKGGLEKLPDYRVKYRDILVDTMQILDNMKADLEQLNKKYKEAKNKKEEV